MKQRRIEVPCTEEQYEKIVKKADELDMPPEEFALFTMLNSQIKVVIGQDPMIAKIERAVNLLENGMTDRKEFDIIKEKLFAEIKNEKN